MQQHPAQYGVLFLGGVVFGIGLILSGMTDPAKVLAFLDLAGPWDPSLAFVMGGAVVVGLVPFAIVRGRTTTLFGTPLHLPNRRDIDRRLVLGSLTFGAGWGLAGFCPGPALVSVAMLVPEAAIFTAAMLAGMVLFEVLERLKRRRSN
jgi:uncharacterized membrane protein YedE/YeeE